LGDQDEAVDQAGAEDAGGGEEEAFGAGLEVGEGVAGADRVGHEIEVFGERNWDDGAAVNAALRVEGGGVHGAITSRIVIGLRDAIALKGSRAGEGQVAEQADEPCAGVHEEGAEREDGGDDAQFVLRQVGVGRRAELAAGFAVRAGEAGLGMAEAGEHGGWRMRRRRRVRRYMIYMVGRPTHGTRDMTFLGQQEFAGAAVRAYRVYPTQGWIEPTSLVVLP